MSPVLTVWPLFTVASLAAGTHDANMQLDDTVCSMQMVAQSSSSSDSAQLLAAEPRELVTTTPYQPFATAPATSLKPFAAPPATTTPLTPFAAPGAATTTLAQLQNAPLENAPQSAPLDASPLGASPLSPAETVTSAPPAGGDAATTFGDPHVGNLKGERFNILNPSTYDLLVIPRGAARGGAALLRVEAKVEGSGREVCTDVLFITSLTFTGIWLGDTRSLEFSVDVAGDVDAWKTMRVRTGAVPWNLTTSEFRALAPRSLAEVTEYQPSRPLLMNQHVTTLLVKLNLGFCTSKVRVVFQKEKVGFSNSLWLSTTGLRRVRGEVGGILGLDGHELAASLPSECAAADAAKGTHMRPTFAGRSAISAVAALDDDDGHQE